MFIIRLGNVIILRFHFMEKMRMNVYTQVMNLQLIKFIYIF